mmetsp:Transcript_31833/g.99018  ORF Transcript_31833/g.99018 Transcript_31833/m.99018 type:complete len:236 (-) Transcript_31833:517-1224(-)
MAPSQRLPKHNDVGIHAVELLCSARPQLKGPRLVEDERDPAARAGVPQPAEPALEAVDGRGAGGHRRVAELGRGGVAPPKPRDGVHDDRRDLVGAELQQLEGRVRLVLQDEGVRVEALVACPLHHPVPPAVVGALEHSDERALRVEPRLLHGAHHGLRAAHVEGHLLLPEDLQQHLDVLRDYGVHGTETGAQLLRQLVPLGHELLEAREAEAVHPVGAGGVQDAVAVHVHKLVAL